MRIPTGVTDQVIYFVAVDATDLKTRETGLTTFTVYRSRNGGTATAMATPTVTELSAANMPGVYKLLLDEDMDIDADNESEEYCVHITQASMAPVTRTFELYRPDPRVVHTGTADAGAAGTIDLQTGAASGTDDHYNNTTIVITGGTGAGQYRHIYDYDGTTNQRASVVPNWTTNPDSTSTYAILTDVTSDGMLLRSITNTEDVVVENCLQHHITACLQSDGTATANTWTHYKTDGTTVYATRTVTTTPFASGDAITGVTP